MSKHSEIGIKGEQTAKDFLQKKGFEVLFTNWRAGKKEVDIIAIYHGIVVFVEVKTRSRNLFSYPEEAVNQRKKQHLKTAADIFMDTFTQYKDIRFDIVSITLSKTGTPDIEHFEGAF